jgi:hypothetical protein
MSSQPDVRDVNPDPRDNPDASGPPRREESAMTHEVLMPLQFEEGLMMPGDLVSIPHDKDARPLENLNYVRRLGRHERARSAAERQAMQPTNNVAIRDVRTVVERGNEALASMHEDATDAPVAESRSAEENVRLAAERADDDPDAATAELRDLSAEQASDEAQRLHDAAGPVTAAPMAQAASDYDSMSVATLRELAEQRGLDVNSRSTKPELIAALRA